MSTSQTKSTPAVPSQPSEKLAPPQCPQCFKEESFCVCAEIKPVTNRIEVVILQHPQEPDKNLGTARLAHLTLKNSKLRVGLSWPNLAKALGLPKETKLQPKEWAVLHLGSGIKPESPPRTTPLPAGLHFVDKKGSRIEKPGKIRGIILLDGSWSQGKTLWWRNAWLLKTSRAVLVPKGPSLYGKMRKEPRAECLSTIETIGEALSFLGESPAVEKELKRIFGELLARARK